MFTVTIAGIRQFVVMAYTIATQHFRHYVSKILFYSNFYKIPLRNPKL